MSSSKRIDMYRDFAAAVYLSGCPPISKVFVWYVLNLVSPAEHGHQQESTSPTPSQTTHFTLTQGKGVELNQREGRGATLNSSQSWVENTNMIDCISIL